MNLKIFFEQVVSTLKKAGVRYAVAGGLITSLYRQEERLTKDLDFLIFSKTHTQQKATQIIRSFGLEPRVIRKATLEGGPLFAIKSKRTEPWIIAGRADSMIGLDFLLPAIPWFESALERAEQNQIDFGFGKSPCLTVEDVIIAKCFAFKNDSTRFQDLDDLKSIFLAQHPLDLAYLSGQMKKLDLTFPQPIQNMTPEALKNIRLSPGK